MIQRRGWWCAAAAVALIAAAAETEAQAPGVRHLTVSRTAEGVDTLRATVTFAGGALRLLGTDEGGVLYEGRLRYDAGRARPVARFDEARGVLEIGSEMGPLSRGFGLRRVRSARERRDTVPVADLTLRLGRGVPVVLVVDAVAARGEIELGGIPLHELRIGSSASESVVRFGAANPARLGRLDISARAAALTVQGLERANAERIVASVVAGQLELAFGGDWEQNVSLEVSATMGRVRLLVPDDVGVRIVARERLLGNVEGPLIARDGMYLSPNWETATRRLEITASATLGNVELQRVRR